MSLNVIQLPPFVLKGLYKDALIDQGREDRKPAQAKDLPYATLGNNGRKIVIVVSSADAVHLPDEDLNFLLGILAACQLTMEDVAILNLEKNQGVTYESLRKKLGAEKLLLFGITTQQISLPIDFPHYQLQSYNQQVYLTAPPLAGFQNNKAAKTLLWNSLKKLFDI